MKNSIELRNEIIKYFMGEGKNSEEAALALLEFDSNVWDYIYERKNLIMEPKNSFFEEIVQRRKETVKNNLKRYKIQDLLLEYEEMQFEEEIKEWNSEKLVKKGNHYTWDKNAMNKEYMNDVLDSLKMHLNLFKELKKEIEAEK